MRQERIRAVLFDMDNTLFDFIEAQRAACREVLRHLGLGADPEDLFTYFLRPVHGFEHHNNIRDFLIDNGAFAVRTFAECSAIYEAGKVAAIRPYPGIGEILESLHAAGIPLCIVTDAPDGNAAKRLSRAGLSRFFSDVITPGRSGAAKPDPASFLLALQRTDAPARGTVLVGDSIRRDILPAQALGIVTVYARYGDRFRPENPPACMPDYVAQSVDEMGSLLRQLTGR